MMEVLHRCGIGVPSQIRVGALVEVLRVVNELVTNLGSSARSGPADNVNGRGTELKRMFSECVASIAIYLKLR